MIRAFFRDVSKKEAVSWAFYDFANSSYALLILSFVFPIFFRENIVGGQHGDFWWGLAVSGSILLCGLASPIIGAIADYDTKRKQKFIFFGLLSILGTALLYFTGPGLMLFSFTLFVVTNFCYQIAQTLYDSFLGHVSTEQTAGRISGLGWGLGNLGGLIAMLLFRPFYADGYSPDSSYTLTFPLIALFFLIFALPAFFYIKEHKSVPQQESFLKLVKRGISRTVNTVKDIRQHRNVAWFLFGFYVLNDALVTIFSFIPIFAKVTLEMTLSEITIILLITQLIGFPASIFFGWLSDRIGSKKILLTMIVLWIVVIVGIALATSKPVFYAMAVLTGFIIGSSQAVARSWFSSIIPKEKRCEFFGFNGFASKVAATTGPLLFGIISSVTSNQRIAVGTLLVYFIISFFIFLKVRDGKEVAAF